MTVAKLLTGAVERLRVAGVDLPRLEARLLCAHAFRVTPGDVYTKPLKVDAEVEQRLDAALARRASREPLAYVLGKKEFWSLEFAVGPGVLVPRPETETLVDETLRSFDDKNAPLSVLDLGTGSGNLLLAILMERPGARGLGIDNSDAALDFARANAKALGLDSRARFEKRDWATGVDGAFDAIVVNPPYLTDSELADSAPEVRAEPVGALAAGPDGLDAYRAVAPQIAQHLAPEGRAFVELGFGQAQAVTDIFLRAGLETERVVPDLSGIPRCLVLAARLP